MLLIWFHSTFLFFFVIRFISTLFLSLFCFLPFLRRHRWRRGHRCLYCRPLSCVCFVTNLNATWIDWSTVCDRKDVRTGLILFFPIFDNIPFFEWSRSSTATASWAGHRHRRKMCHVCGYKFDNSLLVSIRCNIRAILILELYEMCTLCGRLSWCVQSRVHNTSAYVITENTSSTTIIINNRRILKIASNQHTNTCASHRNGSCYKKKWMIYWSQRENLDGNRIAIIWWDGFVWT